MRALSSAAISGASGRSSLVTRSEGEQAADDGQVLQEVVHLPDELRRIGFPEPVPERGGDDDEDRQEPGEPAPAPADRQQQAAAELDDDRDDAQRLARQAADDAVEVPGGGREMRHLPDARDDEEHRNQQPSDEDVHVIDYPFASMRMKAMRQLAAPRFSQAWSVACCTSTSPARKCTSPCGSSMSISPSTTTA